MKYCMLEYVLEMSSFNSQACLISKEMKHRETVFYTLLFIVFLPYAIFSMKIIHIEVYGIVTKKINSALHCASHVSYRHMLDWIV